MIKTIQAYSDKGYLIEARFLLDDLKKAALPSDKKDAVAQLDAKLASAFSADKEDSRYNSALLTPAKDSNGKYGYIDQTGAFVVEAKYKEAGEFSEGLALVSKGDKYQYIDAAGKAVLAVEARPEMFFFDAAQKTVGESGKLIPYEGEPSALLPAMRLEPIGGFHDGLAHWKLYQFGSVRDAKRNTINGREGAMYVDREGKEIFFLYSQDIAFFAKDNGMPMYDVHFDADFHDGAAVIEVESGMLYIDKSGKPFTDPDFRVARAFSEGMACIRYKNSDLWGFIDTAGKVAIKPFFNACSYDYSDDVCVLDFDPAATYKVGRVIDKIGNISYEFTNKSTDNKHLDYYDSFTASGDFMIPAVRETGSYPNTTTTTEVIDKSGKLIFSVAEPEGWHFWKVLPFSNGRAFVKLGDSTWGVIDTRGKFVVQPSRDWEPKSGYRNGLAAVKTNNNGRKAYMDRNGKIVFTE